MSILRFIVIFLIVLATLACTSEPERRPPENLVKKVDLDTYENPVEKIRLMSTDEQLARLSEIKAAQDFNFFLGKGDVLAISVYGEPDLTINDVPIRLDGMISFPLIGDIQAEGLTVNEVKESIKEKLKDYILNPQVSIIVKVFNSLSFTVSGEVIRPGTYPLITDVTLIQALAEAGGLKVGGFKGTTVETADLTHAFIARNDEFLPVDFVKLIRNGDMRFNIPVQPGDYIFIPSGLAKEVYIVGEVAKPGLFAFTEGFTIVAALAQAEGFTPDANLSSVHVVRGSLGNPELYVIDFNDVLKGKAKDMELKPSDVIYVPPDGLTVWSRIVSKIIPSIQAIQTGLILAK
jgi:polysaccharide export outer membrane protein